MGTVIAPNRSAAQVEEHSMATIEKGRPLVTLVNVFTVEPANQQRLVELLVEATERTMTHMPGFISASIHKSIDGKRVVNYAQWRSRADFQAMTQNEQARPHMEAAAKLATFEPILCNVEESIALEH
jgi:quinol monooxygenase YgiN